MKTLPVELFTLCTLFTEKISLHFEKLITIDLYSCNISGLICLHREQRCSETTIIRQLNRYNGIYLGKKSLGIS